VESKGLRGWTTHVFKDGPLIVPVDPAAHVEAEQAAASDNGDGEEEAEWLGSSSNKCTSDRRWLQHMAPPNDVGMVRFADMVSGVCVGMWHMF
jgi:hypothetical protein